MRIETAEKVPETDALIADIKEGALLTRVCAVETTCHAP
jgi:hypothetical protein